MLLTHYYVLLNLAAFRGHKGAVAVLAAMKSDVNIRDQSGRTPLDMAASQGRKYLYHLKFLTRKGLINHNKSIV